MANFEIIIPAQPGTESDNLTLLVEAPNWLKALRAGKKQVGDRLDALSSIMCEMRQDGVVIVQEPASRRVIRIREVGQDYRLANHMPPEANEQAEGDKQTEKSDSRVLQVEREATTSVGIPAMDFNEAKAAANPTEPFARTMADEPPMPKPSAQTPAKEAKPEKTESRTPKHSPTDMLRQAFVEETSRRGRTLSQSEQSQKAQPTESRPSLRRSATDMKAVTLEEIEAIESISYENPQNVTRADLEQALSHELDEEPGFNEEDALAEAFMLSEEIAMMTEEDAARFILDIALDKINAESGAVILSDINTAENELYFAAAKGPASHIVKELRIPRGQGIVGLSINTGCPIAVSDAKKLPQLYKKIAERTGYETESLLCVPIHKNARTFGAIELINKRKTKRWTNGEVYIVEVLADKLAQRLFHIHNEVNLVGE